MNKYFGKTSQKLCVALFVACAALAPIFQIVAVQDFLLFDVAQALIGRPLNKPDAWRHFLSILTSFILVASFAVFGFLYSLATFPRLSGYFRGAAQDLKAFFHEKRVFNRRNAHILLGIFAIAFLGYFALIRSGAGYNDDVGRQIDGMFGWMFGFGRVVTEALNIAIHGTWLIHDRSPLGQLIAMGFLSAAALVMALAFSGLRQHGGGHTNISCLHVAAALIVVFNPYFLDGIAYKYDSPGMAASILFPLVPFLFIGAPRLYTASSLLCLLGMYLSYQASSGIYIMMVIFAALLKYLDEEWTLGETAKFCAKSAALFVAASAVFFAIAFVLNAMGNAYRSTSVSVLSAPRNIAAYFSNIRRDFNGLWKVLCILVAVAAAVAVCRLSRKKLRVTLPLFVIALALATVLSQGGYIFLSDYFGAARGKYGFGALLAILASVSVLPFSSLGAWWKRALSAAPAVLLAWSFFSYASAFGNAHANQTKMVLQYETLVLQDINALFPRDEFPEIEIGYIGTGSMPWSGEVANLAKKYPITRAIVPRRGARFPAHAQTMEYFDSTLNILSGRTDPFEQPLTILLSRRYYDILIEEGTGRVIVKCKME